MGERHRVLPGRLYAYIYAERHIVLPAEKERNGTQKKLQILKKTFLEKDYFKNTSHSAIRMLQPKMELAAPKDRLPRRTACLEGMPAPKHCLSRRTAYPIIKAKRM